MDIDFILNLSKNLYYPFMFFVAIVAAYGAVKYGKGIISKQTNEANAASNKILRDLLEDQKKEIDALRQEVNQLKAKVEHYKSLEDIMHEALVEHFKNNPKIAKALIKSYSK